MNGRELAKALIEAARQAAKLRFPAVDELKITRVLVIYEDGKLVARCQYRGEDGSWKTVQVTEDHLDQVSVRV